MDESDPDEGDDADIPPAPDPRPGPLTADRVSALIRKVIA